MGPIGLTYKGKLTCVHTVARFAGRGKVRGAGEWPRSESETPCADSASCKPAAPASCGDARRRRNAFFGRG